VLSQVGVGQAEEEEQVAASVEREDAVVKDEVAGSSLNAYIDAETGELTSTPSAEQLELQFSPELENALNRSSVGLVEVVLPDGGVMVDLQGRFRSAVFATLSTEGALTLNHETIAPRGLESGAIDENPNSDGVER
jgi:hypothetical protein